MREDVSNEGTLSKDLKAVSERACHLRKWGTSAPDGEKNVCTRVLTVFKDQLQGQCDLRDKIRGAGAGQC